MAPLRLLVEYRAPKTLLQHTLSPSSLLYSTWCLLFSVRPRPTFSRFKQAFPLLPRLPSFGCISQHGPYASPYPACYISLCVHLPCTAELCSLFDISCFTFQVSEPYRTIDFTLVEKMLRLVLVEIDDAYSALRIILSLVTVMILPS